MHGLKVIGVALLVLGGSPARGAVVNLSATLDAADEVPAPAGVQPGAGGTATFVFDDASSMLTYTVQVHGMTADPVAGHLHSGLPGVAGPVVVPFSVLPKNDGVPVTATVPVQATLVAALLSGQLYINFHTPTNPAGEIRGQVLANAGTCRCNGVKKPAKFAACVNKAIKKLAKAERRTQAIKTLKRNAPFNSCGLTKRKTKPKQVACCLPLSPEDGIANGYVCSPQSAKQCQKRGGTAMAAGLSCVPNPCRFPASPSGAFLR